VYSGSRREGAAPCETSGARCTHAHQAEGAATNPAPLFCSIGVGNQIIKAFVFIVMSLGISWDLFWDRAYRDAPLLDPAVANHIDKLFFPGQSDHVDISSSSSLPYAQELAELFSDEKSKSSLSREDVYSGFRALATSNIRNSQSKQQLGNLHFRLFLYRVFDVQSAIDRGGANPTIARVVASDLDLLDRQTGSTPQAKIDEAGSGGTPLASSDELQPLLRTMTTTPKTVSDFRGECLLQWDEDTKVLIQHCFWDLFDFVGGPAAASFTRAHLAALASDATSERCSDARVFISRYDTFLQTFGDGSVARAQVHAILDAVANQVCLSCEGFRIALNAYTMRKIRTAQKVMISMKFFHPGTKLVCRIPDSPRYMRCRYVRRTDKGLFVVAYKGQELTVDYVEELSSDDESLEDDAEAAQAAAAIQCDMSSFNNNNMNELGDGSAAAAVPYVDPWAHIDWSDEAYARDAPFVLRAIAADFPGFQLGGKVPASEFTPHTRFWPIDFFYRNRHREVKHRIDLDLIDYGISFEPFCTAEFLPSLSPEDHKRLMDTAAMRESFRCFFLHLAVELGVHPVALQVITVCMFATVVVFAPPHPPHPPPPPPLNSTCAASDAGFCRKSSPKELQPTKCRIASSSPRQWTACSGAKAGATGEPLACLWLVHSFASSPLVAAKARGKITSSTRSSCRPRGRKSWTTYAF
jgi:hypothetical protein